jgi:hypothetical protein
MNQGTRWVLLMQKIRHRKSHAWAPLRVCLPSIQLDKPVYDAAHLSACQ